MSDDPQASVPASGSTSPSSMPMDAAPSFGIVEVLKFSIHAYSRRFILITVVVLIANLFGELVNYLNQQDGSGFDSVAGAVAFLVSVVVSFFVYSLATAFVVHISFDAKMGRRTASGDVFKKVIAQLLPLVVMSILGSLIIGLGFIALILPGLYLIGVLAVYVPAIVVERRGFGAFKRSAELTKGYRWPIIGTLFVLYVIMAAVSGVVLGLVAVIGYGPALLVSSVISAVPAALISVATAMIYARLLEIKEGVSVDDIAKVFA